MKIELTSRLLRYSNYYLVLIGTGVVFFWGMFILTNSEFKTQIYFHIFSEILMATICIIAGLKTFGKNYFLKVAAHAMLIYSTLNAAGFYAEKNDIIMLILFVFLFMVSSLIVTLLLLTRR